MKKARETTSLNWQTLKYPLLILGILMIVYAIPNIINYLIPFPNIWAEHSNIGNWMSYLGGYVGAVVGGTIGGFVAFIAARSQINAQKANQDEIEIIKQFPLLFELEDELKKIKQNLLLVQRQASDISDEITNIMKNQTQDKKPEDEISELLRFQKIKLDNINESVWRKIDCIRDMNLFLGLFVLKKKYGKQVEILEYDYELASTKLKELEELLRSKEKDPTTNLYPNRLIQYHELKEEIYRLKEEMFLNGEQKVRYWHEFILGEQPLNYVEYLSDKISDQLSEIKKLQDRRSGGKKLK